MTQPDKRVPAELWDRCVAYLREMGGYYVSAAQQLEACPDIEPIEARWAPFPAQSGRYGQGVRSIPMWLAEEAYAVYSARYGTSQSLETLGRRGGFSEGELDMFVPGWRDKISEAARLREELTK